MDVTGGEAPSEQAKSDLKDLNTSSASSLKYDSSVTTTQASMDHVPEQERSDLGSPTQDAIPLRSTPSCTGAGKSMSEADSCAPAETLNEGSQSQSNCEPGPNLGPKPGISTADSMDGIHGLNMFMARWAFDLARNPLFEEKLKERIQKKLTGLRRPNFVNPLTLVSADMGTNFPVIHSFRSLPSPSKVIWPQLLMDISYSGGMELIIETTVDVNETWAFNAIDKAINLVGGQDDNQDIGEEDGFGDESETPADQKYAPEEGRPEKKIIGMLPLRKAFAGRAKKLVDRMADSISKIPLRLCIQVSKVEGQLLVWMSPPPSDRLWISFVEMPCLDLHAKPILANRVMKYSAQLGRVSAWLEKKLQTSFFTSLVFPNCTDGRFPGLLGLIGEWGLRHPGKNLLSELASVAASDGEVEDTPNPESCPEKNPALNVPVNPENNGAKSRGYHSDEKQRSRSNGQEPFSANLATESQNRLLPIRSLSMGAGLDELLRDVNEYDSGYQDNVRSSDAHKSTQDSPFMSKSYDEAEALDERDENMRNTGGFFQFALKDGIVPESEGFSCIDHNIQPPIAKPDQQANRMKRVLGDKAASIRREISDKCFLVSHRNR